MRTVVPHVIPVLVGWLIAAAVTALVLLALVGVGALADDGAAAEPFWSSLALLIGFFAGGFAVGARADQPPLVTGAGIAVCSLLAWVVVNLLVGEPTGQSAWSELPTGTVVALLALQGVAAFVGARVGTRVTAAGTVD